MAEFHLGEILLGFLTWVLIHLHASEAALYKPQLIKQLKFMTLKEISIQMFSLLFSFPQHQS